MEGVGSLKDGDETIVKSSGSTAKHGYTYVYDMRSQLTDANITNIGGTWAADYAYHKSGNMSSRTIQSSSESFLYTGHQMTSVDDSNLSYDENGNLTAGVDVNMVWNWDNMLRSAEKAGDSISLRYDPSGNRIFKKKDVPGGPVGAYQVRKYIIDVVGDLPVILLEMDPCDNMNVKKTYIYANSQILAQHDGNDADPIYFYIHDRLGSVREVIDTDANVVRMYTYEPFGDALEEEGTLDNPFMFTGQWFDSEIDEYYLRARMYDSYLSRFTARDPVQGRFEQPLTLHRYVYCASDPINLMDPGGKWWVDQWEGHPQLTYCSMRALGFRQDDAEIAVFGSIITDAREDHTPFWWGSDIPHYPAGYEAQAEAHALGALELALWYEHMGLHDVAMLMLGEGLHTIQDRWAHAEQGAGWPSHVGELAEVRWFSPDNPRRHPQEYRTAYRESKSYIERFKKFAEAGIWDLDDSGIPGDMYINSAIDMDLLQKFLNSLHEQGVMGSW